MELPLPSSLNQRQLFDARQAFDGNLPPESGGPVRDGLLINQNHRQAASGILGASAAAVNLQPVGKIVGTAGIEASVATAENINRPAHAAASFAFFRFSCAGGSFYGGRKAEGKSI